MRDNAILLGDKKYSKQKDKRRSDWLKQNNPKALANQKLLLFANQPTELPKPKNTYMPWVKKRHLGPFFTTAIIFSLVKIAMTYLVRRKQTYKKPNPSLETKTKRNAIRNGIPKRRKKTIETNETNDRKNEEKKNADLYLV